MTDKYQSHLHCISYAEAMIALRKATEAGHEDRHIWHAYCIGRASQRPAGSSQEAA